jgi:tetratricopeptide (TPR) repeat protein
MSRYFNGLGKRDGSLLAGWIAVFLVLGTFAAYWRVQGNEFVDYDDGDYVFENAVVQQGMTASGVVWAFTSGHASNWHPLTWLSHMLDCDLFGLSAGGHHLTSLIFHALNSVVLFGVLRRLTRRCWPSAFVAAFFAIHPLHVESVAWAAERKDVLSTFFGLLALLAYAHYARASELHRSNSRLAYAFSLLFYALSLMSKPMLVTLPFVLLLLDYWPLGRIAAVAGQCAEGQGGLCSAVAACWRRVVAEKTPFFLLAAISCVITFLVQRGATVMGLDSHGLAARLGNACTAYVVYVRKLVWPLDLAFFYPLMPVATWVAVTCGVLLLALTLLVVVQRRAWPHGLVGWLWFVGMLVPVIGLVQVGEQAMADRYTYLPAVGVFIALTWSADAWLRDRPSHIPAVTGLALLGLLCCGVLTWKQTGHWRNSRTLLERALAVTENNFLAHNNLGVILAKEGDGTAAARHFREAIRMKPTYARAQRNLAGTLLQMGRTEEAAEQYRVAAELAPQDAESLRQLGTTLAQLGKLDEAAAACARAAALAPADALARYDYGLVLTLQGRFRDAATQLEASLRLNRDDPLTHLQLGLTLQRLGDWRTALAHMDRAVHLRPGWPEALGRAAWLLATAPEAALRNGPQAVRLAQRASQLTGENQPGVLDTLAAAYAAAGSFSNATTVAQQAIALADKAGLQQLAEETRSRLKLYQAGKSYTHPTESEPP